MVTGGAGFIGSNLVDALLARGDTVTVVDDLSTGRRANLDGALAAGAELAELDIRDAAALAELAAGAARGRLPPGRPDRRPPLARRPRLRRRDQRRRHRQPARGDAVAGSRPLVFVSTGGAIYGEGEGKQLPLDESAPIEPFSAYGQSKFAAEGYLALYERLYGLSGVSLRLGNVYGPRQDPLGEAGVIAIFCGRLRDGGRPTVFGDGTQTRDYIYVGDVVAAALAAAEREASGRSTSAPGSRPTCWSWPAARRDRRRRELRARVRPGPRRRGAADLARRRPGRARAGLAGETSVADGLRLTLDVPLGPSARADH